MDEFYLAVVKLFSRYWYPGMDIYIYLYREYSGNGGGQPDAVLFVCLYVGLD